ncbi:GNAT family N-acetyltransferase [Sinorhizobium meliloti]
MIYDPMNFDCVFRSATPSDFEELRRFVEASWIELYSPHVPKRSVERFLAADGSGHHVCFHLQTFEVGVINDRIIASINCCDDFITALFVERQFRGNGIGSCLLSNAEIDGGRYLDIPAFNMPALSFYERRGWSRLCESEEDAFGTRVRSITMWKSMKACGPRL